MKNLVLVAVLGLVVASCGSVTLEISGGLLSATKRLIQSGLGSDSPVLGCIGVVSAADWSAPWLAARLSPGSDAKTVARPFAHTLVPIALTYALTSLGLVILAG